MCVFCLCASVHVCACVCACVCMRISMQTTAAAHQHRAHAPQAHESGCKASEEETACCAVLCCAVLCCVVLCCAVLCANCAVCAYIRAMRACVRPTRGHEAAQSPTAFLVIVSIVFIITRTLMDSINDEPIN